jgi:hypothetical protein
MLKMDYADVIHQRFRTRRWIAQRWKTLDVYMDDIGEWATLAEDSRRNPNRYFTCETFLEILYFIQILNVSFAE